MLANQELKYDDIYNAVIGMSETENYRIDKNTAVDWDEYHSQIYYSETFIPDNDP